MNEPDLWDDFAEVFAEELNVQPLTAEQIEQMREDYERGEIASAQSEAAWAANASRK